MITLNISPQTYETIIVALTLADGFVKDVDAMFMSDSFEKVLNEIALYSTKSNDGK